MDRFHIVVANYKRFFCFVDNFHRIIRFNGMRDKVYIFDCTPDAEWREQLEIANRLTSLGLQCGNNLFFVRQRNWVANFPSHFCGAATYGSR